MSVRLCHQQCRDTSAGPGFPVNIINNPWLLLAQNDDKWTSCVCIARQGNRIWSTGMASMLSMSRIIWEPGVNQEAEQSEIVLPEQLDVVQAQACCLTLSAMHCFVSLLRASLSWEEVDPVLFLCPWDTAMALNSFQQIPGFVPGAGCRGETRMQLWNCAPGGVWNHCSPEEGGAWALFSHRCGFESQLFYCYLFDLVHVLKPWEASVSSPVKW